MYVSDQSVDDLAANSDASFTEAGYKFARPDQSKLTKQGQSYAGAYAKAGRPDLVEGITAISTDPTQLASNLQELDIPGMAQADASKFAAQIKGHKALIILAAGTDLIKALTQ